MDERLSKMELARKNITRICKRLSWAFITFFVIYCLVVVSVTFVAIFPPAGFSYVGPGNVLTFLPIVCNIFAGGFAIIVIASEYYTEMYLKCQDSFDSANVTDYRKRGISVFAFIGATNKSTRNCALGWSCRGGINHSRNSGGFGK